MTIQTRCSSRRWPIWARRSAGQAATSSPRRITPRRHRGRGRSRVRVEGRIARDYWWCTNQALSHPDGKGPQLIVDDGGDATLLIHKGYELENGSDWVNSPSESHEEKVIKDLLKQVHAEEPRRWTMCERMRGVSKRTTTGVHRLYKCTKPACCWCPPSTSTTRWTKSKFDNLYGCRESLADGNQARQRRDVAGKVAVVLRYGDVGKGSAHSLRAWARA